MAIMLVFSSLLMMTLSGCSFVEVKCASVATFDDCFILFTTESCIVKVQINIAYGDENYLKEENGIPLAFTRQYVLNPENNKKVTLEELDLGEHFLIHSVEIIEQVQPDRVILLWILFLLIFSTTIILFHVKKMR